MARLKLHIAWTLCRLIETFFVHNMNTNLLEESFQMSLIDHAMLAHQWKNVNLQPPKKYVYGKREKPIQSVHSIMTTW